jgi:ATP-dependent RNA helicase RhlE
VAKWAASLLIDPIKVAVTPPSSTVDRIDQRVLFASQTDKRALLHELLEDDRLNQVLVFTRTKRRADVVARQLRTAGIGADAIHGNKSQNARERALNGFRAGRLRVLVATDIAARGLDVDGISHVINYDLPNEPESYVHRIGRTGRAGASGEAISLCDPSEADSLRAIEKVIGKAIRVDRDHAFDVSPRSSAAPQRPSARPSSRGDQRPRRRSRFKSRSRAAR